MGRKDIAAACRKFVGTLGREENINWRDDGWTNAAFRGGPWPGPGGRGAPGPTVDSFEILPTGPGLQHSKWETLKARAIGVNGAGLRFWPGPPRRRS